MSRHLMLVPSLACPASCNYCFGPHAGGASMSAATLQAVVEWQRALGETEPLDLTFHGGEPLVAGVDFYRMALPLLRDGLAPRPVRFSVQSNLWLLTNEFCELFKQYQVSLGTSLDGPQAINDAQRGAGYYRRTMAGIELARHHGLHPGCICTFTSQSAQRYPEVFDYFLEQGIGFSVHAALPPLGIPGDGWALSPDAHGELLVGLLGRYLEHTQHIRISTLDAMSRSISAGHGGICTFGDCLGGYLAVDPEGWIYSCQRFCGMPAFRLGRVHHRPPWEELQASPAWQTFQYRQEHIAEECGDCPHFDFCRGGCPYNALAASGAFEYIDDHGLDRGSFTGGLRDPHCPAYQRAFSAITERALAEVFSTENLEAVVSGGLSKHGLLRKGKLLQVMRGSPHPHEIAPRARKALAAVALGASASPADAVDKLARAGLVTDREVALNSLVGLQTQLKNQSQGYVNAYLHVTYACNLACSHCYASAAKDRAGESMSPGDLSRLVRQAARAGFHKVVITGGEPLAHPQRAALLSALVELRPQIKPALLVLRTNLAYPVDASLLEKILCSADQIVVSLDGDETSHDTRRGKGTYARTISNLHQLIPLSPAPSPFEKEAKTSPRADIVLAATLDAAQIAGGEGEAVRRLAQELGAGVRFKPVLPLGRAEGSGTAPEFYSSLDEDGEERLSRLQPASTCGLGMNLYVAPGGECYPCYALTGTPHHLGNALEAGLESVLASARYQSLKQVTVDSNQQCRACALRYLCGGFCRAWGSNGNPDAPPLGCTALQQRARGLLLSALEVLDVSLEHWQAAGLPID
jgi:uncharacterized protein